MLCHQKEPNEISQSYFLIGFEILINLINKSYWMAESLNTLIFSIHCIYIFKGIRNIL